jgi:hypothetical protein
MALIVSCGIAGSNYNPVIKEEEKTHILIEGLTDRDGHSINVGCFEIPKEVTRVELRADMEDFYLVEILPVRGWLGSTNGHPSPEIRVSQVR